MEGFIGGRQWLQSWLVMFFVIWERRLGVVVRLIFSLMVVVFGTFGDLMEEV